jgi:hypothetical protein
VFVVWSANPSPRIRSLFERYMDDELSCLSPGDAGVGRVSRRLRPRLARHGFQRESGSR